MRYSPQQIAKAITVALAEKPEARQTIIEQAAKILKRHGGLKELPKLVEALEENEAAQRGKPKLILETRTGKIEKSTEESLEKKFTLEKRANEKLLGGVRIFMGDRRIDASVNRKLSDIFSALSR